ncbi:MAG: hypothetical protein ACLP1X_22590 [Polyangiaceae bacterium]|jgi:hypothetical protein
MLARALAAHPVLPRIAVGGKTQGSLSPGIVRTFDLDLDGFGGQSVT